MKVILSVLALFGILAALPEDELQSASRKAIPVSAEEYFNAYQSGAATANKKFKGKKIELTGRVSYIGNDCADHPYLMLDGVECSVENAACLKSVTVGDKIKVSGKGIGAAFNIPFLAQCSIETGK